MKIKKGDTVYVLKGSHRGKTGEVLLVNADLEKVTVKGVNIRKRNMKPRMRGEQGSTIEKEMAIALSNVAIVDPKTKKPTRVGFEGSGKEKVRVARKSGSKLTSAKKK